MKKKSICFFTGSRSEYNLIKNLYLKFKKDKTFQVNLIISGSHLSKKFGETINLIKKDKINSKYIIKINEEFNNTKDISRSFSKLLNTSEIFLKKLKPDILFLLGDRYETFSMAVSSLFLNIPVAHVHGGEVTEGSFDDNLRHATTKLSHIHFVANQQFRKRVIQLGENPKNVFEVGGLGVDNILNTNLLKKKELIQKFNLKENFFLITYHPSTLISSKINNIEFQNLLKILKNYKDYSLIFTYPSSDIGNKKLIKIMEQFKIKNNNVRIFKSLGDKNYLSIMKYCKLVIGNSSSGLAEAPSFNVPTINVGDRQKGRMCAKSVINTRGIEKDIRKAISKGLSKKFKKSLSKNVNPYGNGGAILKIYKIIKKFKIKENLVRKSFYDLNKF